MDLFGAVAVEEGGSILFSWTLFGLGGDFFSEVGWAQLDHDLLICLGVLLSWIVWGGDRGDG